MARKRSLWSELQRERERRQRAARARGRQEQQIIGQLRREQQQADRRAARADSAEQKRQVQLAHDAGASAAKAMKAQLDSRVDELRAILTSALRTPPQLPFAMLKRMVQAPPFELGDLGTPSPVPAWEDFAPPPQGMLSGLVGGKARHARAVDEARRAYQQALAEHQGGEDSRNRELRSARETHEQTVRALGAEIREHNMAVDELERDFRAGIPEAVEEYYTELLALSQYPAGFPHQYQVAYRQEPRELVVEYQLPPVEVVPTERDFRYVKARGEIDELPRPAREIKDLYASVIHQIALRTMWECFAVAEGRDIVDAVVFNGIVPATNRATGQPEELHLISARRPGQLRRPGAASAGSGQLPETPQGDRLPAPLRP